MMKVTTMGIGVLLTFTVIVVVTAFSIDSSYSIRHSTCLWLGKGTTRASFLSEAAAAAAVAMILLPTLSLADSSNDSDTTQRVKECAIVKGPNNCVSTASVKQVSCYAPPWTFQVTADEAAARIKGVIASDPSLHLLQEQDNRLFIISATRVGANDQVELLISDKDQVVTFRSYDTSENPPISDFGVNRKRLEYIRKTAGVFGVMGEGMTADSFEGRSNINGPVGQLKAFYGLQSGEGFEDVFADD